MNTGDIRTSIAQMESELTVSRKKLDEKFEKLKGDFQELQKFIVKKNEQIATLENQKKELLSLLDQAFAIIDAPSQAKLHESLCNVETEVEALIAIAKSKDGTAGRETPAGKSAAPKSVPADGAKAQPEEDVKKWAKDLLKGLGETAGRA